MTKDDTKKFVNSLEKGDNKQAGTDIKNALADKVSGALDDAKVDVAKSVFTGQQGVETNDYKRTRQYNKLSPRMKRAVDMVFKAADKDADVIANFEKNVSAAANKFGVKKQDLMKYFDKETLTILRR